MRYVTVATAVCIVGLIIGCGKGESRKKLSDEEYQKKVQVAEKIKKIRQAMEEPKDSMAVYNDTTQTGDTTRYFADFKEYRYYFACGPCRDRFIVEKEKYLQERARKGLKTKKRKI